MLNNESNMVSNMVLIDQLFKASLFLIICCISAFKRKQLTQQWHFIVQRPYSITLTCWNMHIFKYPYILVFIVCIQTTTNAYGAAVVESLRDWLRGRRGSSTPSEHCECTSEHGYQTPCQGPPTAHSRSPLLQCTCMCASCSCNNKRSMWPNFLLLD